MTKLSAEQTSGLHVEADPGITNMNTGHLAQRVTVNEHYIHVEDPQFGDFVVGGRGEEKLYYDFFTTPNAYRSFAVAQLCKDDASSTIPNLASFTRAAGLIAQHGLIEYFARIENLTPDQRVAYHVAAEGDDQAHAAFSHALESAIQQWGGPETWHQDVWPTVAELGGTTAVLDNHQVTYNDKILVPGVALPPWVARADKRDIDADNFQYIGAEALETFADDDADPQLVDRVRHAFSMESIEITPDGRFAFKTLEDGLLAAKIHLLATTEHYNDPLNRIQLHHLIHATVRGVHQRHFPWMDSIDAGKPRKLEEYLHMVDQDVIDAMRTGPGRADPLMHAIRNGLQSTAMEDRSRFSTYKKAEYTRFLLDDRAEDYPSEYLNSRRKCVEFGPRPSSVSARVRKYTDEDRELQGEGKLPRLLDDSESIRYIAGPLKNRYIDPLIKIGDGKYKRLSKIHKPYDKLLEQNRELQELGVEVELAFSPEFRQDYRAGLVENERSLDEMLRNPPLSRDQKRRLIEHSAGRGREIAKQRGHLILKHAA